SALVEVASYHIELDLRDAMDLERSTYPVTTTLRFSASRLGGDTFLDYLGDSVTSVTLNGKALDIDQVVGAARISLPALGEDNEVVIHSQWVFRHCGEELHRFVERVDAQVYLHSHFGPADARRV